MADITEAVASVCNPPTLSLPIPDDPLALIVAVLESLGISIPKLPTIQLPSGFCPLD